MIKIILYAVLLVGMFSYLHGEDLLLQYKQKMDTTYTQVDNKVLKNRNIPQASKVKKLSDEIRIIKSMKKSTFESTQDFKNRQDGAIVKFNDKMTFYMKNASKEYSAGTVQMKRYNPDTQIMTLTLFWNKELSSLLSKSNLIKITSFSLKREKAKELFSDRKKHFFHIRLMYKNNTVLVSEVLLYNKYTLYKDINKKVSASFHNKNKSKPKRQVEKQNSVKKCKNYEIMATKLNIRNEPSKKSKILGKVTKGEIVCVYEFFHGWAKTDYGWISKSYVKHTNKNHTPKRDKDMSSSSSSTGSNKSSGGNFGFLIILIILFFFFRK